MSFVPQPQRQNANNQNAVTPAGGVTAQPVVDDAELIFNIRTFDVYFIDRSALMYRDGIAKVSQRLRMYSFEAEVTLINGSRTRHLTK
jgi:hypothetical protein